MACSQLCDFIKEGRITNSVNFPNIESEKIGKHRLFITNKNEPGIISNIAECLASNKINILEERIVDGSLINYTIKENDIEINVFFNKENYDLIGWQNTDLYQNFNITFLSSIRKNRMLPKNIFKLPMQN